MMWVILQHFALYILDRFLQQTVANADQVKDIDERIQSLGEILTCNIGDQDSKEKARREVLRRYVPLPFERHQWINESSICRKLAGIIAKLGPLSEPNGIVKFFKNVDHAKVLNGFVQDLAYAVTDYQVWDADSTP